MYMVTREDWWEVVGGRQGIELDHICMGSRVSVLSSYASGCLQQELEFRNVILLPVQ